jgi:ElaB/YqjD/DUF883 family membrane-anchored ribosome-binding protein
MARRKNPGTRKQSDEVGVIEREIARLMQDLESRVGDLNALRAAEAAGGASALVSERLSETIDRIRNGAHDATDRLSNGAHSATDDAARFGHDALRKVEVEIEQRPLLTLAIAAGLGFLAGMAGRRQ